MNKTMFLDKHRHATWLELFFDLIFVVALGKVTHLLARTHNNHLEDGNFVKFVILFLPFWWIWVLHTSFFNRFDSDGRFHRILTLILMFVLIILSTTLDNDGENSYKMFLIIYAIAKLVIVGLHIKNTYETKDNLIIKRLIMMLAIGTIIAFSGVFFMYQTAIVLLILSILFEILFSQVILHKSNKPADKEHLIERIGLLAIVLLGESVISLTASLTDVDWSYLTIITGVVGFAIISMIWWIYFDSLEQLIKSKKDKKGNAIIYSQLLTYMSFAIIANTIRHAILLDLNLSEFRFMAISGMILLYIGKQTAYIVNVPDYRKYILINTLLVLLIASAALLFSKHQYILIGMAISFMVYILLNYKFQMRLYGKVNF